MYTHFQNVIALPGGRREKLHLSLRFIHICTNVRITKFHSNFEQQFWEKLIDVLGK